VYKLISDFHCKSCKIHRLFFIFDEEAYAFYTGQVILDARKSGNMTQKELAEKLGVDKSYVVSVLGCGRLLLYRCRFQSHDCHRFSFPSIAVFWWSRFAR